MTLPTIRRIAACCLLLLPLAGCGDEDSPTAPPPGVAGVYTLTSINDQPLHFAVRNDPELTIVVANGALRLGPDGTFRLGLASEVTRPPAAPRPASAESIGDYRVNGTTIRFEAVQESDYSGTIRNDSVFVTRTFLEAPAVPLNLVLVKTAPL
ncbi:hypothetical protein BH23GEM4_BH23GEM4_25360 [soil metagenome]